MVKEAQQDRAAVQVRREPTVIPTRMPADPDQYPAYLDNRVYQGSSGAVYPLPFHERIEDDWQDRPWDLVTLRNEWVELAVLPELGGRLAWAIDRTRDYDFFYRNHVVKPALVGLAGPWISGGVEFNWPQHHRPATFLPTAVHIEHEDDGAVTVWCADHDPFHRMKGMHGVRLRPDSTVIELRVRLHNRSDDVQTFLWWANVAARAGDHYQSFFPTDVHHVADHARRAITAFPGADRPYYGWDYPAAAEQHPGADRIDWYRNIKVPTSYMCVETDDEFFGGYDHAVGAGFIHLADRHISPGKKQWTWGNAEFGWAWDRNLTESDGPYVELMAGVYTDNQPDFAFLAPGETKSFSQYWYPFQDIGPVHQATLHAACALLVEGEQARIGVSVTRPRSGLRLALTDVATGATLWEDQFDAAPGSPVKVDAALPRAVAAHEVTLTVAHEGAVLLSWTPRAAEAVATEPAAATEPPPPEAIASADELYTTGLHLAQYRHATRRPEPYWEEALRRDPCDARCRTALAVGCLRRGDLGAAEEHLRRALDRLMLRNPNPLDGEPHHRLGQVLARSGRVDAALAAFGKAAWNQAWADPSRLAMARLLAARGEDAEALALVAGTGSARDPRNQERCIEAILLRRMGATGDATRVIQQLLAVDPLDAWARHLAGEGAGSDGPTLLDVALEYASVGETGPALDLLAAAASASLPRGQVNVAPLAHLHAVDLLERAGRTEEAGTALRAATHADARWCHPSRPADLDMLGRLTDLHPGCALVHRLLGHQLYHVGRRVEAQQAWVTAVELDDSDPITRRNLAVAAHNIDGDPAAAEAHYDRALALAPGDARLVYELDQLRKRTGCAPQQRLAHLAPHEELVAQRDDLTVEYVELLTHLGRAEEALGILEARDFQPWEGGEGRVLAAWEQTMLALAGAARAGGRPADAVAFVNRALDPPVTLGEGPHPLANRSALHVALGDALAAQGRDDEARAAWLRAAESVGDFRTMAAVPFSDLTYFSVLAARRLGLDDRADTLVEGLARWSDDLAGTTPTVDYFATSLPSLLLFTDDLERRNRVEVAVLRAQVATLEGDTDVANERLREALGEDPNHPQALRLHRDLAAGRSAVAG
ncbi:DUF5107 domain-containing protein [Propioniciclava soli]|uniref:DUF5107 domain-containing protein n=1 Tax=Propioniciclava soli TaxID=2775081 RepID=UPI001E33A5C1|nr:DUF5107 domain-containing protein [Propioniciclava soli]